MFDVQVFAEQVCALAYPGTFEGEINKWDYHVQDVLGDKGVRGEPNLIVVTWALAGVDADTLDYKGDNAINFELICNASSVRALNAFHWALMQELQSTPRVRLSALIGDVQEDEVIGRTRRSTGRAFRVFGLTVDESIVGMSQLFEEVEK